MSAAMGQTPEPQTPQTSAAPAASARAGLRDTGRGVSALVPAVRFGFGGLAAALALALGVQAAMPIYDTLWLWAVAGSALVLGLGLAWARERWRLGMPVVVAIALGLFVVTVVPVAVPQSLGSGFFRGLLDGLAAAALGWKQLLTLTLPVGTYRTVLVPVYLVFFAVALLVGIIAHRSPRPAAFAAAAMLIPVAFGTIFGASQVSPPFMLGPIRVSAPREILLWIAAAALAAVWVVWVSGAQRRSALRLGRAEGATQRRGGALRAVIGAVIVVIALGAGAVVAPLLETGARAVPRDRVDPELVVQQQASPLAAYRAAKSDAAIDEPLFTVSGDVLPDRLRLAVLDEYDGQDFHVSAGASGRFTRFPSGEKVEKPSPVTVTFADGYSGIWAPTAPLGSAPRFGGARANDLADAFYVNRETGAAILIPGGDSSHPGVSAGDSYTVDMATGQGPSDIGEPMSDAPLIDLDRTPELSSWITRQKQGADAEGLTELIDRLRQRGYLSHSMTDDEGETLWIERLADAYGARFEPSAGGHSLARIESLFRQLNAQQVAAGEEAEASQLVAAIGDDEQFATAAALVARALGYDARVVVGVRLGDEAPASGAEAAGGDGGGTAGVPSCAEECTGENLAAWTEVRGTSGDWVSFDATPQIENRPQRLEQGEQLPEFPTQPEERDANEADPPIGLGDQGESSDEDPIVNDDTEPSQVLRYALLSAAALALIVLPFLFLPLAKRWRTGRRRAERLPELRALGAWDEMLDRARDAGVRVPSNATRSTVAQALGTEAAAWAATEVDRAVFSPGGVSDETAAGLWQAAADDRAERRGRLGFWGRLRAAYSLASYGARRRGKVSENGASALKQGEGSV